MSKLFAYNLDLFLFCPLNGHFWLNHWCRNCECVAWKFGFMIWSKKNILLKSRMDYSAPRLDYHSSIGLFLLHTRLVNSVQVVNQDFCNQFIEYALSSCLNVVSSELLWVHDGMSILSTALGGNLTISISISTADLWRGKMIDLDMKNNDQWSFHHFIHFIKFIVTRERVKQCNKIVESKMALEKF